jgi:uncharacterized membrane protein
MSGIMVTGAVWLHIVATVVVVGYFTVLTFFVLPALARALPAALQGPAVAAIERRALPFVVVFLVVFLVTGIYLTGNDTRYGGAGSIDSPWAAIILAKHAVIVGMLAVGVYVDALAVRAGSNADDAHRAVAVRRFTLGAGVLTALGLLVLLLTAVAQTS